MQVRSGNSKNVTISLDNENLNLLNKLCKIEHRKRNNQIIHMMKFYIQKNNIKI